MVAWNMAILGAGKALGLNLTPWTLLPGLSWGGSPFVGMAGEAVQTARDIVSGKEGGGKRLKKLLFQAVPYKGAVSDILAAEKVQRTSGDPYGILRLGGVQKERR
jgi:hypothetical protein